MARRPPEPLPGGPLGRVTLEQARPKVLAAVARIPAGRVASYAQIAWSAGLPGRARLVGRVLAEAPAGLPWHRVMNAAGEIALPKSSPAHREQRRRLREEGVQFEGGRVSFRRYGWQPADPSPLLD